MADSKISALTEITSLAPGDLLVVVDVSDTTMAPSGTNKKITKANALSFDPDGSAATAQAASQPLDADLTIIAAANNGTVLAATTASFLIADASKLDGIEAGATADQSAAEILAALLTVDGAGSGLDADLLDGNSSAAFAAAGHNHTGVYEAAGVAAGLVDDLSGVSDAATARTNLGLGTAAVAATGDFATAAQGTLAETALQPATIGVTVQAYDADLADIAAIADVQGDIIVRGASGWERLAKSATSTHVLTAGASQPEWAAASGGSGGPSPWSYATLNLTFV